MGEFISFQCDVCGVLIENEATPLVIKEVVGVAPGAARELDLTQYPLPQRIRDTLQTPRQNIYRCVSCHAWEYGEDLVDETGAVVVSRADYPDLTTFKSAATTATEARQTAVSAATAATTAATIAAQRP